MKADNKFDYYSTATTAFEACHSECERCFGGLNTECIRCTLDPTFTEVEGVGATPTVCTEVCGDGKDFGYYDCEFDPLIPNPGCIAC